MRIHFIACQVFYRELSALCARSSQITSVTWLPQGLHDTPDLLRSSIRSAVESLEEEAAAGRLKYRPDVIVLGYGLCSNGVVGVESGSIPIVVPRTDDCIGVFLGSQARYLELFGNYPGTYWFNNGWMETAFTPTPENYQAVYEYYKKEYDEDNAQFLMEMETSWIRNYRYCGYIRSPIYENERYLQKARDIAAFHNWEFVLFEGSGHMLTEMAEGRFPGDAFLTCPPYSRIEATYGPDKLKAVALEQPRREEKTRPAPKPLLSGGACMPSQR